MTRKEQSVSLLHFEKDEDPGKERTELCRQAIAIADKAYAPYSGFSVGAAIQLEDGRVFCGNNQENASFPAGTCAERAVLFYLGANFPEARITRIAVTTLYPTPEPVAPCGICRQALLEKENLQGSHIEIVMTHPGGKTIVSESVANLLPMGFRFKD
jgi:cytidine deaminase